MEEMSVADYVISMEGGLADRILSNKKNVKTKLPIHMYFQKNKESQVIFIGEYMEIYIPSESLTRKNMAINGREIYTYGIFQLKIWDTIPDRPDNTPSNYTTRYMYPSTLVTIPSDIFKRNMSLSGEEEHQCYVLGYKKGDIFIKNVTIPKQSDVAGKFMNIVMKSFLPPIVKYTEIADLVFGSAQINGVNFSTNAAVLEIMIAAQSRYVKDLMVPYRHYLNRLSTGDQMADLANLKFMKALDLPHVISTFTALKFQDIGRSITMGTLSHRAKIPQKKSSVEDVLRY